MPVGYSSPARNFFLLGASGDDTITNFFRGVNKSADTVFNSFNTTDVQYNGATGSVQEYGISGWKHDSTSAAQAKEHGWIENRTLNLETLATSTIFDATISSTIQSDARVNDILFANGFIYACGFADENDFIAKYDESSGQIVGFSTSVLGNNRHFKLAVDANGEIYACGYIETSQNQITVVKYDANLNPVWSKLIDAYGQSALKSIAVAKDGNIVCVGYIGDQAHHDDSNKIKGYVVKVSSFTGEVLWDRTVEDNIGKGEYDFPCNIIIEDLTFNDSGEMFIVGYKSRYSINSESKDSGFIIKYDDVGNMLWQNTSSYDNVALHSSLHYYRVKTDSDTGQTITLGRLINFDSAPGQNNAAVLLSKYSSSGELLWRREIDSSAANERYDGISLDADSTFYYVAFTDTSESLTNSRPDRYVFGKVSTSGNGLGAFQYDDQEGVNLDYVYNGYSDVLGRLSDGSVRNDTSDLITYPFNANKIVFDDFATHLTNKKAQINTAGNFFKSDFVEIRPTDFQLLNLLGDAYSGSGNWLDQSGKGNDGEISSGGSVSKSISQIVIPGKHPGSYNYGTGGAVTYDTYGTVNEDTSTTLPYSNSDWAHYGGKARDLGTGGFKVTLTNSAASNFMMACWVKFDTYIASRQMGINLFGNYVYWETLANGNVAVRHNGGSRADSTGGTGIDDGNWHHIALSRDGSTLSGYVDGSIVVSTTNGVSGNSVPANADFWFFGGSGTAYNFDGQILDPIINIGTGSSGGILVPTKPAIDSNGVWGEGGSGTGPFYSNSWEYASPAITLGGGTFDAEPFTGAGSVKFDGVDDHLNITGQSDLAMGTGDFTMECWAWFSSKDGSLDCIMDSRTSTTSADGWLLGRFQTPGHEDKIEFYTDNNYRITGDVTTPDNTWVHVAVVRQSGTTKLYVNGTAASTTYSDSNNYSNDDLIIGENVSNLYQIDGFISNFRMVKGTAVYTSNFTPPTSPLTNITNTKLLCCQFDDTQTINTGKMYKSDTLYTTKADVVSNGTLVDDGEQFDTDSSPSAQSDDVYFYYVPSGNETNGDQIFSADPSFVNDNSGSNNHFTTWWSHNGSNWVWGSGTGTYDNDNYASQYQFLFGSDSATYRLDQNIDFYGVGNNGASSPTKMGGTAPTLNQYGTDTLTSAVSPGTIEMNGGARTMVTTTGTPSSGPTYTDDGYFEFNGVNDNIFIDDPQQNLQFVDTGDDFSLEVWANRTAAGSGSFETILSAWGQASGIDGWIIAHDAGSLHFTWAPHSQATTFITGGTLNLNTWYHIMVTKNGNAFTLYLDGESVATGTNAGTINTSYDKVEIGHYGNNDASWFTGQIGEVRIYPRGLTEAQVAQNYNSNRYKYDGIAANTSPLTGPGIVYDDLMINFDFGNDYTIERLGTIQG